MAVISKNGVISFFVDGIQYNVPIDWQAISILATFENDNTQANISTDSFELSGESANALINVINGGLTGGVGIFEGVPFQLKLSNQDNSISVFDGYIDLTEDFVDTREVNGKVSIKFIKKDGLNVLEKAIGGLSYGYLESIGVYSDSDYIKIPYVVEKKDNALELITLSITIVMLIKELSESIKATAELIADIASLIATGLTGSISATIKSVAQLIIITAYNAILLIAIINLADTIYNILLPVVRESKVITFRKLLSNVLSYVGYTLESDIDELDLYTHLPANTNTDIYSNLGIITTRKGTNTGLPSVSDYGYLCTDMFAILKDIFKAQFAVIGNTVQFRNAYSPYWIKQSTYKMPSVLEKGLQYNTQELQANRVVSFKTDISDIWTIDNYTGTSYEVITDAITYNTKSAVLLKGLDAEVNPIPFALGTRKDELNAVERLLKKLGSYVDDITKVFGSRTNYASKVQNKVGMLKISTNNPTISKALYLNSSKKIPANQRDFLSAKLIENKFHIGKSFVRNNFYGQKKVFTGVKIPFGFEDYLKVIENSYFYDDNGNEGKIEKLEYNLAGDFAIVDYYIRSVYTKNLKETFIEP